MKDNEYNIDLTLEDSIEKELSFDEAHRRLHEKAHSELLDAYAKYQINSLSSKQAYKTIFFYLCSFLLVLPLLFLILICILIYHGYVDLLSDTTLISIVGTIVTFISNIVILPKIIAEYCFNKQEDAVVATIFTNAQKHDVDNK